MVGRDEDERTRALRVDLPADLKHQLKREALDLDITIREHVREILEDRLPRNVRKKIREQAAAEGTDYQQFMLRLLRDAGVIGQ